VRVLPQEETDNFDSPRIRDGHPHQRQGRPPVEADRRRRPARRDRLLRHLVRPLQDDLPEAGGAGTRIPERAHLQGGRGRVRGHRHGVQHLLDAHLRLRQEQPDDHAVQRRQLRQVEAAGAGEQVDRRRSRFFFIFDVL
jgi:hypothetical protein